MLTTRSTRVMGFMPPVCINPACFRWGTSLLDFLAAVGDAGFDRVEVSIQQAVELGKQLGGMHVLASQLNDMNLQVEQFSGLLPAGPVLPAPLLLTETAWRGALRAIDKRLDAATALGCRRAAIVCNPRTDLSPDDARHVALERLGLLAERAIPYDVRLAVEFIGLRSAPDPILDGQHSFVADLPSIVALLNQLHQTNVGLLLDTCHLYASGTKPGEIKALPPGLVEFVQVSDVPAGVDPAGMRDDLRCLPGDGILDLPSFLTLLADTGYRGPASIELFSSALWSLDPSEAAAQLFDAAVRGLNTRSTGDGRPGEGEDT